MKYAPLFVLGCPRSGTTWVQLLLNESSKIATAPETHIFSFYLDWFRKQWEIEHRGRSAELQGGVGLSRLLSQEEFNNLCRVTAIEVLDKIASLRPSASIVVEKSPQHAPLTRWISELLPEARFIHVIRDPRDTVVSITKAARSWGADGLPRNPIDAARMWVQHVSGARVLSADGNRYLEVKYEDIRANPVPALDRILAWLGIPEAPDFIERAVANCGLERISKGETASLPTPGRRSPPGFFGTGSVGGFRDGLSRGVTRDVEIVCDELMTAYGYQRTTRARWSVRLGTHRAIRRVRESLDWQLQRLAMKV